MRGAAGSLSRRYTKIGAGNPNLVYLRQKSKSHLLRGTASCRLPQRAPRLNRGRTSMPVFSQRILPGLPVMSEQTYAEFPVWAESTAKPVQFTPMPKQMALKLWHRARDFDRQTHEPGKHGGAIGPSGLQVLHAFLFDFLNYTTGRLDPSYAAIARKANLCERAVADALKRLHSLGIITWIRRCSEQWINGRYVRKQQTNAYCLLPTGWLGYQAPP